MWGMWLKWGTTPPEIYVNLFYDYVLGCLRTYSWSKQSTIVPWFVDSSSNIMFVNRFLFVWGMIAWEGFPRWLPFCFGKTRSWRHTHTHTFCNVERRRSKPSTSWHWWVRLPVCGFWANFIATTPPVGHPKNWWWKVREYPQNAFNSGLGILSNLPTWYISPCYMLGYPPSQYHLSLTLMLWSLLKIYRSLVQQFGVAGQIQQYKMLRNDGTYNQYIILPWKLMVGTSSNSC